MADRPSVRKTMGSTHRATPSTNSGASFSHDVVWPYCLTR
ncbi:Uncharacterised protein [Bordetella pertussis]|nr:Uncharacterised protein [Bordetella pertussis]